MLHNRSVELAKSYNIQLEVLSSFVEAPGTIVKEVVKKVEKTYITGVAQDKKIARIALVGMADEPRALPISCSICWRRRRSTST